MNMNTVLSLKMAIFLSAVSSLQSYTDNTLKPAGYTILEDLAKEPILTPAFAKREVLKIRLNNELEAILVSDPLADESAAAMVVKTGSFEDLKEAPGIAHFLEHMLFLGTKKYPQESGYQQFIAENGGLTNAFTASDFTGYLFSVNNQAFEEALDRFSEFFKEPLFNPSGVARELQAIDQEYAKNVQNDQIRMLYVMKAIANENHPYHGFGMGNSKTLSQVSQNTLIKWYDEHYSANLMKLIVYSKLPLETLKELVVKDFSGIIDKQKKALEASIEPITNEETHAKIFYIEPVKNLRNLTLVWNLPQKFADVLDRQPESYVCHVLGDEGEGSLLAALKNKQLAELLGCSSFKIGPGLQVFYLDVDLTENGVKKIDLVIEMIFEAIAGLKQSSLPKYIFDEVAQISKIKYAYKSREDIFETVMKDAMKLPYENIQTFPLQSSIVQKFDPELISEFLQFLTPSNAEFFLLAPPSLTGVVPDKQEQWLGVKYAAKAISASQMNLWKNALPTPEITLPPQNHFIPKNLSILNKIETHDSIPIPNPETLLNESLGKIYFAKDNTFGMPEIYFYFEIKTPSIKSSNASSVVLADLYVKALKDALNKLSYPATIAGLEFEIQRTDNGIGITVNGFNDNANLLFQEIAQRLNQSEISEESFNIFKESLLRDYENAFKSSPLKAASDLMKSTIYKYYTSEEEKANAIKAVDFQTFNTFLSQIFKQIYVEGIIFGNTSKQNALETQNILLNELPKTPYLKSDQQQKQVIILPENTGPYFIQKQVDVQGNAIILLIEESAFTFKTQAAQQILMQAIGGPFFSTLRTKQQTGYLVDSSAEEIEKKLFNLFVIQSNTHDPETLLARIELFIEGFNQEIGHTLLLQENFETIRSALIENLSRTYNNTKLMGETLKTLAFKRDGDFDWINKLNMALHNLTYEEFLEISKNFLGKTNKQRLAILIDGMISKDTKFQYKLQTVNELRKLSSYSAGN